ncbi:hypothetical protein WMF30_41385 [Sorangium sp. So ce134]
MRRSVALVLGILGCYSGASDDSVGPEIVASAASPLQTPYWIPNADASNNNRSWAELTCGTNEYAVGIAYKDMPGPNSDVMDGVSPWCASPGQPPRRVPNADLEANPRGFADVFCDSNDVVVGIAYKDLPNSDFADGATVLCASANNPGGTEAIRENGDVSSNPRESAGMRCNRGDRVVGLAYKDTPQDWGNSDYADAVTVQCR